MRFMLTADWHLRDDAPPCRTDDFVSAQARKIHYLFALAEEQRCDGIIIAGDLFHRARPSFNALNLAVTLLGQAPCPVYTVAGNHDLPAHSLSLMSNSAYGVLAAVGVVHHCSAKSATKFPQLFGASWEEELPSCEDGQGIGIAHTMILPSSEAVFEGEPIRHFARRHVGYQLIVVGHHHATFTFEGIKGKVPMVVSPGGITRQTADEENKTPCVFIYNTDSRKLSQHELPHEGGVVSREHIDLIARKESRVSKFVEMLGQQVGESGTNFEENLITAVENPSVPRITKKMCIHALEGVPYVVGRNTSEAEEESGRSAKRDDPPAGTTRVRTRRA